MSAKTTILGADQVEIEFMGSKMRVALRPLTIRQLLEFCGLVIEQKRFELVVLATGKPEEWVDQLPPLSFAKLYDAAFQENFRRATPIIQADPTLAPVFLRIVRQMQSTALEMISMIGNDSSPEPSPSASPAETGTVSSTCSPEGSSPSSAPIAP